MSWREYVDAFLGRGNYDRTGRDQEIARLRAEVERLTDELRSHVHRLPKDGEGPS